MLKVVAMLAIGCLFTGFGSSDASDDVQVDAFKKELKAMAGTWRPTYGETDGNKAPEERLKVASITRDESGKVVARQGEKGR
jgi:hypothetical protein